MLLDGLHIPLSTPFHPDGRLNLPKLAANVTRYSHSPAAGFIVLGGPLPNRRTAHAIEAESEEAVRETWGRDPWAESHLILESVEPWTIRLDGRD